jgi:hypothetical protein
MRKLILIGICVSVLLLAASAAFAAVLDSKEAETMTLGPDTSVNMLGNAVRLDVNGEWVEWVDGGVDGGDSVVATARGISGNATRVGLGLQVNGVSTGSNQFVAAGTETNEDLIWSGLTLEDADEIRFVGKELASGERILVDVARVEGIEPTRIDITDAPYSAVSGSGDDTGDIEAAMGDAGVGEVVYIPAGTWHVHNVNIPSNTEVEVEASATIKHFGSANGQLFSMQGVQNTSFAENIYVRGVNGRFTVDLYDSGGENTGFRVRSVQNFAIENVDFINKNDATGAAENTMATPNVIRPDISFLPFDTSKLGGEWEHAHNGLINNAHAVDSTYGWGLVQMTGGEDIHFQDISSEGGVTLRLENFEQNVTTVSGITADNVTGENCKSPLTLQAHNANNGTVSVTDLTSLSCSFGVNLAWDSAFPTAGFTDVDIDGVDVNDGTTAQNRLDGDSWEVGDSQSCVEADANLPWEANVTLTNIDCGGLPNNNWPQ